MAGDLLIIHEEARRLLREAGGLVDFYSAREIFALSVLGAGILVWGYALFGLQSIRLQLRSYQQLQDGFEKLKQECKKESHALRLEVRGLLNHILELRDRLAKVSDEPLPPLPSLVANGTDTPTEVDLAPLKWVLLEKMSLDEIRSMAWDLSFRAEGLDTPMELVEALLMDFKRRGRIGRVLRWVAERRPDIRLE